MPITPFHLGVSVLAKSVHKEHSIMAFAISQCLIDVEPIINFFNDAPVLHGFSHTVLGATLIGLASLPLCRLIGLELRASIYSVALGVYSHLLLDSLVHEDMHWKTLGLLAWHQVDLLCGAMFIAGYLGLLHKYGSAAALKEARRSALSGAFHSVLHRCRDLAVRCSAW